METKIELSKPEDRTVFIEILTNEEYSQGKVQELISGNDCGGKRFKGAAIALGLPLLTYVIQIINLVSGRHIGCEQVS